MNTIRIRLPEHRMEVDDTPSMLIRLVESVVTPYPQTVGRKVEPRDNPKPKQRDLIKILGRDAEPLQIFAKKSERQNQK